MPYAHNVICRPTLRNGGRQAGSPRRHQAIIPAKISRHRSAALQKPHATSRTVSPPPGTLSGPNKKHTSVYSIRILYLCITSIYGNRCEYQMQLNVQHFHWGYLENLPDLTPNLISLSIRCAEADGWFGWKHRRLHPSHRARFLFWPRPTRNIPRLSITAGLNSRPIWIICRRSKRPALTLPTARDGASDILNCEKCGNSRMVVVSLCVVSTILGYPSPFRAPLSPPT